MEKIAFILDRFNSFTPTRSGATATIYYHCCTQAIAEGLKPLVFARPDTAGHAPFPGLPVIPVTPPEVPAGGPALFAARAERKLLGYRQMLHRTYIGNVLRALRENSLEAAPKITSNDPELAVVLSRKFPEAPVLHWFHNHLPCKPRFRNALVAGAVRCVAVSNASARWAEADYGFTTGRVRTVYNAVDHTLFVPNALLPPGPTVLNFVGHLGHEKGPDILLDAALCLAKKGLRFGLQLVGSNSFEGVMLDDYQRGLAATAAELERLGVPVRRTGYVAHRDVAAEVGKAHIHVFTSRWDEPFGMATLEGMACGLATVASNTGGTPEVVGDAGFLFERGNVQQLAAHLERLILDENLRAEYGAKARRRAEQFTWAKTWAGIREVVTR